MGHLNEKYNKEYFLGGIDSQSHIHYGLPGYSEFNKNKRHRRFEKAFQFIKLFSGDLEGKDILEIGFGRGELIPLFLKENCHHYHGIDFSSAAFRIAQERYSDPKVQLDVMDAKDISDRTKYDVIVLNQVIEHIPAYEMESVWGKLKSILRPHGTIIAGTQIYDNPNESDDTESIHPTMGMKCNKQSIRSIAETCEKYDFVCLKENQSYFGLMHKDTKENAQTILKPAAHSPGRLLIGCVAENSPKYRSQALKLIQSIRWFGGKMSGANIVVCMVDEVEPKFAAELEKWGAFVQVVKRFSKIHAPSNKIRFLELPETAAYDTIALLDCDTVIVSDPFDYIKEGKFQAAMVGMVNVTYSNFQRIFAHYNLPLPHEEFKTTIKDEPTIWYCNAGVLIFPREILPSFLSTWKSYIYDLYENSHLLDKFFFCEQVALALAYFKDKIPFAELPKEMNYHLNPKIAHSGKKSVPVIIHYHRYINKRGFLLEPKQDPYLLEMVQKFNKQLKRYKKEVKRSKQANREKGEG